MFSGAAILAPTPWRAGSPRCDSIDPDCSRVHDGLFFNARLGASNVWEFSVDPSIVDEAAAVFEAGSPFAHLSHDSEALESVQTSGGPFFVAQVLSWSSDAAWVSVEPAQG